MQPVKGEKIPCGRELNICRCGNLSDALGVAATYLLVRIQSGLTCSVFNVDTSVKFGNWGRFKLSQRQLLDYTTNK